jgi:hypothetical protein
MGCRCLTVGNLESNYSFGAPSLALDVTIVVPTRYARGNVYLLGYMGHDWSQQYGDAS